MQNLLNELIEILKQDDRFVADNQLLKNIIIEKALSLDTKLLKLLQPSCPSFTKKTVCREGEAYLH